MVYLFVIVALALIFDYINGFHDAANSIATIVSTKVLTPLQAVIWAAFFNFLAYFIFDHGVAETVGKIVNSDYVTLTVIFSGLIAAIAWNLFTWWYGIPSSSSHTLIGGFAGAGIAHAYLSANGQHVPLAEIINMDKTLKTMAFIVLAPLIGMVVAFIISIWCLNSFRKSIVPKIISIIVIIGTLLLLQTNMQNPTLGLNKLEAKAKQAQQTLSASQQKYAGQPLTKAQEKEIEKNKSTYMKDNKDFENAHHLMTSKKPYVIKFMLFEHNMKWVLLGFIIISIALFSLFLSSLNYVSSEKWFKRMQLLSSAAFSLGHGGNDSQKVMGIIMAAFVAYDPVHYSLDHMISWVPLACYTMIALGTLSGGWKIIKTMGTRITKVTPFEGVAAETAGALTLFVTEMLKIPVSTTHTITGAIIGVGATKRLSAVRWGVTINLLWAWILTIPVSALIAGIVYFVIELFI